MAFDDAIGVPAFAERLATDILHGARRLARTPLFTAVSVLSLALGIAASIAVFGAANTLLWQPPPHMANPDSLVRLFQGPDSGVWSYPDFEDVRRLTPALADAAAFGGGEVVLTLPGGPARRTIGALVSPNYFDLLGAPMARGRGFVPADLDADDAVVISHAFWRRAYGSRADVLGQALDIRGRAHVIVGVAPPGLRMLEAPVEPDVWCLVPRDQREHRGWGSLQIIGRLAPGATLVQLRAQLGVTAEQLFAGLPAKYREVRRAAEPIQAYTEREARVPVELRTAIMAGLGGVLLVVFVLLALAASNVTNMMLTRASERQAEIAVRLALGGTRRRLVGQLLTESFIVAGLAGGLGLLVVSWLFDALASGRFLSVVPAPILIDLDARAVAFALAVTIVTGLLFGLAPALQASKPDLLPALRGVRPSARLSRFELRGLIVTAQVAVSLALVATASLFLRSYWAAQHADLGFDPDGVVAVPIDLTQRQYSAEAAAALFTQVAERLAVVPGVQAFTFARTVPLSATDITIGDLEVEGHDASGGEGPSAFYNIVGPGYFSLMRTPMAAGREFTSGDREGAPKVAIVNEAFAGRYWPGGTALGKRIEQREVVGVVRNAKYRSPGETPHPHLWVPAAQSKEQYLLALARTDGDAAAVGRAIVRGVHELEPTLLIDATTLRELTSNATVTQQMLSIALGAAGLVALALAVMGVYGVMAFVVSLRTREMGIRIALGANPTALAVMVVREGLGLAAVGLGAGLVIAIGAGTIARAVLVGVGPLDPVSLASGAGLLALAAAAASYVPARRAARADPIVSLKVE